MVTVKINGNDYNLKFGLRVLTKSNLISKNIDVQIALGTNGKTLGAGMEMLAKVLAELFLAGCQKEVAELKYDLENEKERKEKLAIVYDLLDEYSEEDGNLLDLYNEINEELEKKGFMADVTKMVQKAAEMTEKKAKAQNQKSSHRKISAVQKNG